MLRVICEEPPRRPTEAAGCRQAARCRSGSNSAEGICARNRRSAISPPNNSPPTFAPILRTCRWRRAAARFVIGPVKFIRRHRLASGGAALLAAYSVAGVAGVSVAGQRGQRGAAQGRGALGRPAPVEQQPALRAGRSHQAASRLDRRAKAAGHARARTPGPHGRDAQGDRQTQLDLVDAYTRLGIIRQRLRSESGDPAGAFVSLGKALAIAGPLAASDSKDREAIRALALVEQSRSEILWQTGRTPEAVSVMRKP